MINVLILVDLQHHGNIKKPISIPDFKKDLLELSLYVRTGVSVMIKRGSRGEHKAS